MRKLLAVLVIVAIPVLYFLYAFQQETPLVPPVIDEDMPLIRIGTVPLRVEVADTPEERARGLGGRESLGATNGLLFVFDESGYHAIWMRDVSFPIDVLWVGEDFTVVDILPNLSPETFPRAFEPRAPARFVIETNANYAASSGIVVGDMVTIPRAFIPEELW